jgi:hypothetical protein
MKYFIPEWDDRIDPEYDFLRDNHSQRHNSDPFSDNYMWEIFGIDKVPFDGVLVSRVKIEENGNKKRKIQDIGIHRFLRLPEEFPIIGDCGAFGYINEKVPRYDPIEILEYYRGLGFNSGVTVDHLVVPKQVKEKDFRMRITFENGLKAYDEWSRKYKTYFQLLCAVQGWDIQDYIQMLRNYADHGVEDFGIGGLARKPTTYICSLIDELVKEIRDSHKTPHQIHFFGLARQALFPYFEKLEDLGIQITFDSASFLRRAWLSAQNNYMTVVGKGYSAIRIPQIGEKTGLRGKRKLDSNVDVAQLKMSEQECLNKTRLFDKGETSLEAVMDTLRDFDRTMGQNRFNALEEHYRETLTAAPWKKCTCPICLKTGVEVIIFRGNNRNRRRGFHNVWIFYNILKEPEYWVRKIPITQRIQEADLASLKRGDRVLVLTSCTKEKRGYDSKTRCKASDMYQGRLFKTVKELCRTKGFDYAIISAKYGLLQPDEQIEGYEKMLKAKKDIEEVRPKVEERLKDMLNRYDKVIVIAGLNYLRVLEGIADERFSHVKARGYGDLCSKVKKGTNNLAIRPIEEFLET